MDENPVTLEDNSGKIAESTGKIEDNFGQAEQPGDVTFDGKFSSISNLFLSGLSKSRDSSSFVLHMLASVP